MGDHRRLAMKRQPAQAGDRQSQRPGDVRGRGEHGQTQLLQSLDVGAPVRQAARNSPAEENNVRGLPPHDILRVLRRRVLSLRFLLRLAGAPLLRVRGHGRIGDSRRRFANSGRNSAICSPTR